VSFWQWTKLRDPLSGEPSLLAWSLIAAGLCMALLFLTFFGGASSAVLLIAGFGGAVGISATAAVQDGGHLRRASSLRRAREGVVGSEWASTGTTGLLAQTLEEALATRREMESLLEPIRYVIEPEPSSAARESLALTDADLAILTFISEGLTTREMALQMGTSTDTTLNARLQLEQKLRHILVQMRRSRPA
jgi:DNA-binding CsgD family transcriptional regulator